MEIWIESKKITEGLYGNNRPRHSAILGNGFLRKTLSTIPIHNDLDRKGVFGHKENSGAGFLVC